MRMRMSRRALLGALVLVCGVSGLGGLADGAGAAGPGVGLPIQPPPSPLAPSNTKAPAISGTPVQGAILKTTTGTWSGPSPTYTYRWQRCLGSRCTFVSGATARTYRITSADVSRRLRALVTATNPAGSATKASALTAPVRAAFVVRPAPVKKPAKKPAKTKLKRLAARITIQGRLTDDGARITSFTVRTARGARVRVHCRGKGEGCLSPRSARTARTRRFRLRSLERSFRAGVVIELRLTKRSTIGRYMRVRIRAGRVPARLDRCLKPGKRKPVRCR
jgi:hypothetical protein